MGKESGWERKKVRDQVEEFKLTRVLCGPLEQFYI